MMNFGIVRRLRRSVELVSMGREGERRTELVSVRRIQVSESLLQRNAIQALDGRSSHPITSLAARSAAPVQQCKSDAGEPAPDVQSAKAVDLVNRRETAVAFRRRDRRSQLCRAREARFEVTPQLEAHRAGQCGALDGDARRERSTAPDEGARGRRREAEGTAQGTSPREQDQIRVRSCRCDGPTIDELGRPYVAVYARCLPAVSVSSAPFATVFHRPPRVSARGTTRIT